MDNKKDEKNRTLCATAEEGLKARGRRCDLLLFCAVYLCVTLCVTWFGHLLMPIDHGTLEEQGKNTTNPS